MVPGGGVEPPRPCDRRILSPLRLPVPPSRLFESKPLFFNQVRHFFFALRLGLETLVADLVATTFCEKLANLSTAF